MEDRTCACRRWQISGIPCPHAIACILDRGHDIQAYLSDWFLVETYMRTYENVIHPINGQELWPETGGVRVLPPPWYEASKGRTKKKRRKGSEEMATSQSQSQSHVHTSKKGRVFMTCSSCGEKGHNKCHHNVKAFTGVEASRDDVEVQIIVIFFYEGCIWLSYIIPYSHLSIFAFVGGSSTWRQLTNSEFEVVF